MPSSTEWRALAALALEPNVFYEPAFARAAAPVFGRDVGAGLVWSRTTPPRLLGFFPARIERRRYGIPLPVLTGWTHPFAPLGTPLVDRATGASRSSPPGSITSPTIRICRSIMLLPYLSGGRAHWARHARPILDRRGGQSRDRSAATRARCCRPAPTRADYLERAVGGKKRKELRRQRKRLADHGVVMSASTGETGRRAARGRRFLRARSRRLEGPRRHRGARR